ncbi:hypothetical protein V1478_006636 [Vespula squamosa]|uniref:Uncharacterized protein n=1 Tax=Vespula squamosa TaxID=30214 RepID=A0ABD2B8E0_VESSQ
MNSIKDKEGGVPKTHLMSSYNQSTIQYIQNFRTSPAMKNVIYDITSIWKLHDVLIRNLCYQIEVFIYILFGVSRVIMNE